MTTNHYRPTFNTRIRFESAEATGAPGMTAKKNLFLPIREVDPKRVSKVLMHFTALVNVILGSVLDTAESYIVEVKSTARGKGLYKRDIKRRFALAEKKFGQLKSVLYSNIKGRESLYMDLLDNIQEDIEPDLKKLYFPIKQVLDKHDIKESHLMAQIEVAWFALYLACRVYKAIVEGATRLSGIETEGFFRAIDPRDTFGAWEKFCDTVQTYSSELAQEISQDHNINLAFEVLLNKLCDADYVDNHCIKTLEAHPEFDKRANEDERQTQENECERAVVKKFTIRQ